MNRRVSGGRLEEPADRAVELVGVAARKIGARRAVVRHEQRVADEDRVADPVADVGGRVPGRVEDLDLEPAERELLAVGEQLVEVATVGVKVGGVEDRAEDPLHVLDVLADADPRAGLGLDVRRAREMIGVGVGLERPVEGDASVARSLQDRFHRAGVDLAGILIVVEHGIDHGAALRRRYPRPDS